MALSTKQAAFVAAFLRSRNGASAAVEAGYATKHARSQASRMLRHPDVAKALHQADASIVNRVNHVNVVNRDIVNNAEVSVVRTIQETAALAYYDHPDITPELRFMQKTPALRLLSAQLGAIQPPAPVAQGPLFMIHIHTAPQVSKVNVLTNGKVHD